MRRNDQNLFSAIPTMIKYLCLNYYLITDRWRSCGYALQLNPKGNTVIGAHLGGSTVYGETSVGSFDESIAVYRWTFEIVNVRLYIAIGLDTTKWHINANFAAKCRQTGPVYSCVFDGNMVHTNREPSTVQREKCKLRKGDQITMILNVVDETLRFDVNGVNHGIILDRIQLKDKRYYMAVNVSDWTRMEQGQDLMKLIDFSIEQR